MKGFGAWTTIGIVTVSPGSTNTCGSGH